MARDANQPLLAQHGVFGSSCEASFADCNRREPGGILGAREHLEEIE
jgi:hypothetical protein